MKKVIETSQGFGIFEEHELKPKEKMFSVKNVITSNFNILLFDQLMYGCNFDNSRYIVTRCMDSFGSNDGSIGFISNFTLDRDNSGSNNECIGYCFIC